MVGIFHRLFNQHEWDTVDLEIVQPKATFQELRLELSGYEDPIETVRELTEVQRIYHLQCRLYGDRKKVRA